jgi:hypothetical protein
MARRMVAANRPERAAGRYASVSGVRVSPGECNEVNVTLRRKVQTLPADALAGRFWPNFDGRILPGDQCARYSAGQFNDTPVLIGTNSDEGALFARPGMTPARTPTMRRLRLPPSILCATRPLHGASGPGPNCSRSTARIRRCSRCAAVAEPDPAACIGRVLQLAACECREPPDGSS